MVGGKNTFFTMEGASMHYAPKIMRKIWKQARELGYQNLFIERKTEPITDDHLFMNQTGIPSIDIIGRSKNSTFPNTWHTTQDNLEKIDKNTLKAVGNTLMHIIYSE